MPTNVRTHLLKYHITVEHMGKETQMTKEEFKNKMQAIADKRDTEGGHIEADDLMCELLKGLGYGEGVEIFEGMDRWYA